MRPSLFVDLLLLLLQVQLPNLRLGSAIGIGKLADKGTGNSGRHHNVPSMSTSSYRFLPNIEKDTSIGN